MNSNVEYCMVKRFSTDKIFIVDKTIFMDKIFSLIKFGMSVDLKNKNGPLV